MHGPGIDRNPKMQIRKQPLQKLGLRRKWRANPKSLRGCEIAIVLELMHEVSNRQGMHQVIPRPDRVSVDEGKNGRRVHDRERRLERGQWVGFRWFVFDRLQAPLVHLSGNHLTDLLVHAPLLFEHYGAFWANSRINRLRDPSTTKDVVSQLRQDSLLICWDYRRQLAKVTRNDYLFLRQAGGVK